MNERQTAYERGISKSKQNREKALAAINISK